MKRLNQKAKRHQPSLVLRSRQTQLTLIAGDQRKVVVRSHCRRNPDEVRLKQRNKQLYRRVEVLDLQHVIKTIEDVHEMSSSSESHILLIIVRAHRQTS